MARNGPTVCDGVSRGRSPVLLLVSNDGRARCRAARCPTRSRAPTPARSGRCRTGRSAARRAFGSGTELKIGSCAKQRVAGKVHLRDQALRERPAEQREVDVRGPPGVGVIAPRVGAGLDRDEPVPALGVGQAAARAGEVRVQRGRVVVDLVRYRPAALACQISTSVSGHGPPVAVQHPAGDDDPLAQRLAGVLGGQVGVGGRDPPLAEQRPGDLGQPLRQQQQRLAAARAAPWTGTPGESSGGCTPGPLVRRAAISDRPAGMAGAWSSGCCP